MFSINNNAIIGQKMINRQVQSLLYSYETLGNLLSSAENFAGLPNEQYKLYNISSAITYEELKSEFAWELHCFQLALKKYNQKYGPYIFPDGYSKEKIINDCKRYIKKTEDDKDKILFYSMINIINGEKTDINFDKLFEQLDKTPDNKFDQHKLNKLIGPLNYLLDDIGKDAENEKIYFNEDKHKSKIKEKLKNISENNVEFCNILYGTYGVLIPINNYYRFISDDYRTEIDLTINSPINKNKKLYVCKDHNTETKIYIEKEREGFYNCSLFENIIKNCPKSEMKITDSKNRYGFIHLNSVIRIPILEVEA